MALTRPDAFDEVHAATSERLEIAVATAGLLRDLIERFIDMAERSGGFMKMGDQETLRDAKRAIASMSRL